MNRTLIRTVVITSMLASFFSGCDDRGVSGEFLPPPLPSVSVSVEGRTVTLSAGFGGDDNIDGITEYGFYFGPDGERLECLRMPDADERSYSLTKNGLEWSTLYFYRVWVGNGRDEIVSDLMSVRTGDAPDDVIRFNDPAVKAICVAAWDLNADGELSQDEAEKISGIGLVFKRNTGITSFDELEFFTGLEALPDSAFMYCENLTSARLPQTVSIVGEHAFEGCSSLSSITLPDRLTIIGHSAFASCGNLSLDKLPENLVKIDDAAFGNCEKLAVSSLPESIVEIGNRAFVNCGNITLTKLPPLLKTIEGGTFENCSKVLVEELPQELVSIGEYAFVNNCIKRITVPAGVSRIGEYAFSGCKSLSTVTVLAPEPPKSDNSMLGEYARVIYVPPASLEKYRAASGWSHWKDKIQPIASE